MPEYEIEQYELWTQTYRVTADDPVSAVLQVLHGDATPLDNSLEFVEPDDSRGLPIDELGDADVQAAFAREGMQQWLTDGEIVDSIRRVVEIETAAQPEAPAAGADL